MTSTNDEIKTDNNENELSQLTLKEWLARNQLMKIHRNIQELGLSFKDLATYDDDELKQLSSTCGLDTNGQKKFMKAVSELKSTFGTPSDPTLLLKRLGKEVKDVTLFNDSIELETEEIEINHKRSEEEIKEYFCQFQQEIKHIEEKMLSKLNELKKYRCNNMQNQLDSNKTFLKQLTDNQGTLQKAIENSNSDCTNLVKQTQELLEGTSCYDPFGYSRFTIHNTINLHYYFDLHFRFGKTTTSAPSTPTQEFVKQNSGKWIKYKVSRNSSPVKTYYCAVYPVITQGNQFITSNDSCYTDNKNKSGKSYTFKILDKNLSGSSTKNYVFKSWLSNSVGTSPATSGTQFTIT